MKETHLGFTATLHLIGINPYVYVPDEILQVLFLQADRSKSPIPVKGTVNSLAYRQTLVKFKGAWRLYVNRVMLENATQRIGENLDIRITFDPQDRTLTLPSILVRAFAEHPQADHVFRNLSKSRQQEIIRYFSVLKSAKSESINLDKLIRFLSGKGRFLGRDSS